MNNQINQYQQRLYYKLFAALPSFRRAKEFNKESNLDFKIGIFNFFRNKDFWFARHEVEDKYLFLFGLRDKPIKDICGNDTCLIIDFDKNTQFNNDCLGFFSIKNSQIHVLINNKLLNEIYPYINTSDFKISNFKSFDNSLDFDVIDLGNLDGDDFMDNLDKLINASALIKSHDNIKEGADVCKICSRKKDDFKIDSDLSSLSNIKPELCGKCIEKIVATEFYTKVSPMLKENRTEEINTARKKFGNDQLFDIGLRLLEKYNVLKYIGVKKLFYVMDRDSYLLKRYMEYSDKNNLLINNISQIKELEPKDVQIGEDNEYLEVENDNKPQIPRVVKTDSLGNKNIIMQMNMILEDLANGKSEDEAIKHANVSENTYQYWIIRGRQDFGDIYVQFYNFINEFKLKQSESHDVEEITEKPLEERNLDEGIYEPLLDEYESSLGSMNESGIAWVEKTGNGWTYSRSINGKTIELSAQTIQELYEKVINHDLIWGIRDYDRAKEFIDIPDDFEIPSKPQAEEFGVDVDDELDPDIYAPLPIEYERSFSSMNQSGIAWVNKIGNKFYYVKSVKGKNIRISAENIPELHKKVKKANKIWGIRDYSKASQYIDIPDDFEVPVKPDDANDEVVLDDGIDKSIYAPLSQDQLSKFNPNQKNKTGIAWVNRVGNSWYYQRQRNGKTVRIVDSDIVKLHEKVIANNQVWGIIDIDKARKVIETNSIDGKPVREPSKDIKPSIPDDKNVLDDGIDKSIYAPLSQEELSKFNPNPKGKTGIAWVSRVGNNWSYKRQRNGKIVKIDDSDIVKLHEKVIANNQVWGIIDIDKARKVIETNSIDGKPVREPSKDIKPSIPDDFEIIGKPDNTGDGIVLDEHINESIYAPLSQEELSKFNPNPKNKTGIAWVNRVGNTWCYQRQRNGKTVRIVDSDIVNLHKKVITNNQVWGIIDIDKARKVIETNSIEDKPIGKPSKTIKPIIKNADVTVNYIEKYMNEFEVLIKGVIKNKDLIDVLTRFDLFNEDIKRIIVTSRNRESDIFIELEMNKYSIRFFEEKIGDLGWKINR